MANENPILEQAAQVTATTKLPPVDQVIEATSTQSEQPTSEALLAVQEAIGTSSQRISANIASLEKSAAQSTVATDTLMASIADITSASQTVQLAKDTADLQAQNATINAYKQAGGMDAQTALMAQLQEDADRVDSLLDEKQAIVSEEYTGIQLIDGIIGSLASFQTELELSGAREQQAQTMREISNITTATESIARSAALTKETINASTIQANYEKLAAEGNMKAAMAEIENINTNANAMNRLMTADSKNVAALTSIYKLEEEQEDRAIKREVHQFTRERMAQQREEWEAGRESRAVALEQAKLNLETMRKTNPSAVPAAIARNEAAIAEWEKDQAFEAEFVRSVQAAQSLAGLAIEDKATIMQGYSNPRTNDKYVRLQELGGVADPVMGLTPADAALNYQTVAPSGNIKGNKVIDILNDVSKLQADAFTDPATPAPKTKEALQEDFNNRAKAYMQAKATEIKTGDMSNPYHGAPFSTLEQMSSVASTPLYQKVLKATGMKELNPQLIVDTSVAAMRAGTITPEQAASGISTIFEAAANLNNTQDGGFRRAGLLNQTSYNASLERPSSAFEQLKSGAGIVATSVFTPFTSAKDLITGDVVAKSAPKLFSRFEVIDLMDQTKVQLFVIKQMSAQKQEPAEPTANNNQ